MKKEIVNERLLVDCAWHVSSQMHFLVNIDSEYYLLPLNNASGCKAGRKVVKQWAVAAIKNEFEDYEYIVYGLEKKTGYNVKIGREITEKEFLELKERFELTEDQISAPFETSAGDIYGKKYRKTYMCVQIAMKAVQAIMLEEELIKKGIEASACAPGRLNIRIVS